MQKLSFEAIGTVWSIETASELSPSLQQKIHTRIEQFDHTYSRFRDDSLVTRLRIPGTYTFPDDVVPLLDFYHSLYTVTRGAMSPLIGQTLEHTGYDPAYSLTPKSGTVIAPAWGSAMVWSKNTVTVKQPIVLDVGAAGKGYLVDIIAKLLQAHKVEKYVIDASGDICHSGDQSERIGLENPLDATRVLGIATLQNQSLCASSSNRRTWGQGLHHIMNAKTGLSVHDVVATWVIADTTMVADGLATALFFLNFNQLSDWQFQAVRLLANGRIEKTDNFMGELFV